ncbi:MAG: methyltransferase, partial [Nitrospirota bacterium]
HALSTGGSTDFKEHGRGRLKKNGAVAVPKIFDEVKKLREIWSSFRQARVLISANNYRIFDRLIAPKTADTISKELHIDLRATEILLDALTGIGLLNKRKDEYRNGKLASRFLVYGRPYYQGDIIRHADTLWKNWSELDEVVKTGKPSRKAYNQEAFVLGMHNLASLKVKDVIKKIGLKGVRRALDLGGGPGTYSMEMAKKGVDVSLIDYPETIEIAKRIIGKDVVEDINFISGDFMTDDIGKGYDLIFISQILHAYSEKDNLRILKRCKEALNDGGRIVVQEFYIDNSRIYPPQAALFSVNMLVNTERGRCYSPDEIKGWFLEAGMRNIKKILADDTVLISGVKGPQA